MLAAARGFMESKRFFILLLALFVCSAGWIALSGRFSMAYDENTHLGIIQLYSDRRLPFWSETPAGSESLGAVMRDPSYLYHYLLSFPYRIIDTFVQSEMAQVIILRFINIAIFVAGLVTYRRILLRTRASIALIHSVFAVLVLLPAAPFLAAQINYDNLLFLASGVSLLLAMQFTERLRSERKVDTGKLALLVGIALLGSLIKYAFLPIFAGICLWLAYILWRHVRSYTFKGLWHHAQDGWRVIKPLHQVGLIALVLVGGGLFVERYGVNIARYHTPTPECNQVLSIAACQAYGPWNRNYQLYQQKLAGAPPAGPSDPFTYTTQHWLKAMSHQMVFTLNGRTDYFKIGDPLILPKLLVIFIGAVGIVLTMFWYRKLRRGHPLDMLVVVTLVYVGALWAQGYMDYVHLGQPVAIQGRYLMPVLPLVGIIAALAIARSLRFHSAKLAFATACTAVLLLQGGGAMVFILRSDERWYWENNAVVHVNQTAQGVLKRFVIDR